MAAIIKAIKKSGNKTTPPPNLLAECLNVLQQIEITPGVIYCNATSDGYLCWPYTQAGKTVSQHCPPAHLNNTSRFAFRICGDTGMWLGHPLKELNGVGWTNQTDTCDVEDNMSFLFKTASRTRTMENIGYPASLLSLVISLIIFFCHRSLNNNKTWYLKHVFITTAVVVLCRLIIQFQSNWLTQDTTPGITRHTFICKIVYVILEYSITSATTWTFLQGHYVNTVIRTKTLQTGINRPLLVQFLGWGTPIITTAIWVAVTEKTYAQDDIRKCWFGYNMRMEYWIMQGPRFIFILVSIVRKIVILSKLKFTNSTEMMKLKKSTRAALILLILGLTTNILNIIETPTRVKSCWWMFATWSYVAHGLQAVQGVILSTLYCFRNAEVCAVVKKDYQNVRLSTNESRRRTRSRNAGLSHLSPGPTNTISLLENNNNENRPSISTIPLKRLISRDEQPLGDTVYPYTRA